MKAEKMVQIYSDFPVLRDIIQLREDSRLTSTMKNRILMLEQELQLLVLYRFCMRHHMASTVDEVSRIDATLEKKGLPKIGVLALKSEEFEEWETLSSEWLQEIQSYKPSIRKAFLKFSNHLFDYNLYADQLRNLMMYVIVAMDNIHHLEVDMVPDEKMTFESLKEKLNFFRKVFKYTRKYWNSENKIGYFNIPLTTWAWNAACFCLLHWALDEKEENLAPKSKLILCKLQQNFDRVLPDVTRICLSYLKATRPSAEERWKVGDLIGRFVGFLLGNLKEYVAWDHFEMLLNGMILLITFLMDPPSVEANQGELILIQADEAVETVASLIVSINYGKMNEVASAGARNFPFNAFRETVSRIKVEVRETYPQLLLDSLSFNCPKINMLRLFDSMIENLTRIYFCFPEHPILTIRHELVLLRGLHKSSNLKELGNEHKELKDSWTRICNMAHRMDRTIKSFTYPQGFLWEDMFSIFDFKEESKHIMTVAKWIRGQHMHGIDSCRTETNLAPKDPSQTNVQTMELVVGFDDKAKDIRDWLVSGSEKLSIISIIGMPGLGKTTLAKKVYNDPSIKRHFTAFAWCTVSQSYDSKKLLLDILKDVTVVNDRFFKMDEEELVDRLRKCLKGQKYFIVLDDIWEVGAWNALKSSFPDDNNYSRILFTSRIHDVVFRAKSNSSPYHLTRLSDQESWELLERRLFHDKNICPRNFVEFGRQIAIDCKGIPLVVVLVAGLLNKNVDNLDWWREIGESIASRISEHGCAHILELSYRHLPEPLKACFLYFGLFPEDKVIAVQKLTKLWVSEGFIQKQESKEAEIVAKEYVMDLVGRSLLIVTDRSSSGGIKACRIHDLLREFCIAKSEEENFFKLLNANDCWQVFRDVLNKHYRVCIQAQHWKSVQVWNSSALHSLLISPPTTFETFGVDNCSFWSARFLHILDLEDVKFFGDFPEEVTTLIFLRYLGIWCTARFIPSAIVRLENLETLRVRTENTCGFPSGILQMENLRHVDIRKLFTYGLFGKARPMKNIQSFSFACLTYGKETEVFLRTIPTIRKLRCQFGTHLRDGQMAKLDFHFLNHLESLNATHEGPSQLRCFEFSLPTTLKKLTLSNFGLPWTEISRIVQLPNLEVLKILGNAFKGKCWEMEDDQKFKKLKFLKLQKVNIEQWNASHENFLSLEQIVVEQCHRLEEIPTTFGDIPSLRMIRVRRCRSSVVDSAKEIEEQQIELGNENFKILIEQSLKHGLARFSYRE